MNRAAGLVCVLAGAVALLEAETRQVTSAPPQTGSQAPVFRGGTAAVMVDVAVQDKSRRAITGLQPQDFTVLDNGVPQQIDQLSFGRLPIDVTIALDVSYSVTGLLLDRLRLGIQQLMGDLRKEDRLKLLLFSLRPTRAVDFTSDEQQVERALQTVTAGGGTSLYDSISVALVSTPGGDRRQLIVFFTDGGDSTSTSSPAMVRAVAERSRATLTFVMPTSPIGIAVPFEVRTAFSRATTATVVDPLLASLARETSGSVLPVGATTNLGPVFRQILDVFRQTYVLMYVPKDVERGGFHTITVTVNRPDATVQARRGYFGASDK